MGISSAYLPIDIVGIRAYNDSEPERKESSNVIYADNAATTKMSEAAVNRMFSVINENFGNPSSLYSLGQRAKEILESAREDYYD